MRNEQNPAICFLQFLLSLTSMDSSMVQWKTPQFSTRALSPSNAWRWVLEKCRPSASERNCISFHPTSGAKWVTLTVGDSDDFFPKGRWQQQDDSGNYPWQDKVVREGAGQEMGRVNSGEDVLNMPLTFWQFISSHRILATSTQTSAEVKVYEKSSCIATQAPPTPIMGPIPPCNHTFLSLCLFI